MNVLLIAGHGGNPYDPGACGCGYQEAKETRRMVDALAPLLRARGCNVVVFDKAQNAYDVVRYGGALPLSGIDYVVECHLNAGVGDQGGNGYTTGTEVLVHASEPATTVEQYILNNICALGFTNRGVKRRNDLAVMGYVVSHGISHALIETCFIDDLDDMRLYEANFDAICKAIADGIVAGFGLSEGNDVEMLSQEEIQFVKNLYKKSTAKEPSNWAKEMWAKNKEAGLTDGSRPQDVATREEVAAMIERATKAE